MAQHNQDKELACEVIHQACKDYLDPEYRNDCILFFKSAVFVLYAEIAELDLNGIQLMLAIQRNVKGFKGYGKRD